jgi:hypothetical protein
MCAVALIDAHSQAELSGANNSLCSVQLQNEMLLQQMAVLKEDVKSSAAAASSSSVALSASEVRIETMKHALKEQQSAHLAELLQIRDEQYVLKLIFFCYS